MALTEKQGGSDVRANTTRADPRRRRGPHYRLTGHKWFCSAPMSDAFLMLAQAPGGLSCFLVPRWKPDGSRNPVRIQRLKDKLGDRSNASSEIELARRVGPAVGEEGRGVRTIIEMVNHTRLDCILGSTALMRQGVAQATWHAAHRVGVREATGRPAPDGQRPRRPGSRVGGSDHRPRSGWPVPTTPPASTCTRSCSNGWSPR